MIKTIKITNFRGLKDLEIKDFKRFNILSEKIVVVKRVS